MSELIKIGNKVFHRKIYDGKELMEIIGIRKSTVELQGDYSGGTHNVIQSDWMPIDGIIDPDKKECEHKIDGSCPLHNLHCGYPDCERVPNPINA